MTKYATTFGIRMPMTSATGRVSSRFMRGRWYLIPLFGMIVSGAAYVFAVNHTASQGYRSRDVEKQIYQLQNETKKLELHVADLESMDSVGTRLAAEQYVPVAHVDYLTIGTPSVALR